MTIAILLALAALFGALMFALGAMTGAKWVAGDRPKPFDPYDAKTMAAVAKVCLKKGGLFVLLCLIASPVFASYPIGHRVVYAHGYHQWDGCRWLWYPTPVAKAAVANYTTDSHAVSYTTNIVLEQGTAPQGNSVYGVNELYDNYGQVDLGLILDKAHRLADRQIEAGSIATGNALALVESYSAGRARVAEIVAKGHAAAATLNAAGASASSSVIRQYTFNSAGASAPGIVRPLAGGPQAIAGNRCAECHMNGKAAGGLSLDDLSRLTDAQTTAVLERITSADPERRMPRGPNETPGVPLSIGEIKSFFDAANPSQ